MVWSGGTERFPLGKSFDEVIEKRARRIKLRNFGDFRMGQERSVRSKTAGILVLFFLKPIDAHDWLLRIRQLVERVEELLGKPTSTAPLPVIRNAPERST